MERFDQIATGALGRVPSIDSVDYEIASPTVGRVTVTQHALEVRQTLRDVLGLARQIKGKIDATPLATESDIPMPDSDPLSLVIDACACLAANLRTILQEIADRL